MAALTSQLSDSWAWEDHFLYGAVTFPTTVSGVVGWTPWIITDTSTSGTPTYVMNQDYGTVASPPGLAKLGFSSTNEVQNICLSFNDCLTFSILDDLIWEVRVRAGQTTWDSATQFSFGLIGDRNDTIDNITYGAMFRVDGGLSTAGNVYAETDDNSSNNDDVTTGLTLTTTFRTFRIDFNDLSNVKFYMSDNSGSFPKQVALGTTFNMEAYAGSLQPFFQLQKTADNNTDYVEIDYASVRGKRNT